MKDARQTYVFHRTVLRNTRRQFGLNGSGSGLVSVYMAACKHPNSQYPPVFKARRAEVTMPLFVRFFCLAQALVVVVSGSQCVNFKNQTASLCSGVEYDSAWVPNALGLTDLAEAAREVGQFWPLVDAGCSASLRPLLCLLYFPPCRADDTDLILPCRELCEQSRAGCQPQLPFGVQWPDRLFCEGLPRMGGDYPCYNSTSEEPVAAWSPPPVADSFVTASPLVLTTPAESEADQQQPATSNLEEVSRAIANFLVHTEQLQTLQADTLRLQQQKLQLEMQLLLRQLAET